MREAYIPYTKLVTLSNTTPVEVTLHDSSGSVIECNYIQVAAVSGGVDGYFFVTPEVTSAKGYANMKSANAISSNETSGQIGQLCNRETGVAVLSLPASDKTSKLKLSQKDSVITVYAVTYGNVKLSNTLKDNILPRGN